MRNAIDHFGACSTTSRFDVFRCFVFRDEFLDRQGKGRRTATANLCETVRNERFSNYEILIGVMMAARPGAFFNGTAGASDYPESSDPKRYR